MTATQRLLIITDVVLATVIFAAALGPRLHLASSYNEGLQGEEELYDRYASAWARGEGAEPREKALPWHPLGSFTHRPPGYALFVGAVYRLAGVGNVERVRTTQALLDSAAMVLLYVLGVLMFGGFTGRFVGATAAVATARYDFLALFVTRLLAEGLFTWLMILALVLAIAGLRRKSAWLTLLAAFVLGWSNLTRPFLVFLLPGYLIWIAIAPPYPSLTWVEDKGRHVTAALVGMLLAIGPVTYRNWQFHGAFIPISTNGGYTLYKSITQTEGLAAPQELATEEEVKALGLSEVEQAAEFRRRAVTYLIDHPDDAVPMLKRKVRILLAAKEGHKISHVLMPTPQDAWFYPLVLALGALGVLVRPTLHWHGRLLLYGAVASQVLVSLLANAEVRYRVPVVPLLALMAAWSVWGSVDYVVTRLRPRI